MLREFASDKHALVHVAASRPAAAELALLSRRVADQLSPAGRDLERRPFSSWDDAFEVLARLAERRSLLLVLDEFPELLGASPELPSVLRAQWETVSPSSKLRVVLCGSAVRTMEELQAERAPLYGRFDLALQVHPFRPHEASLMLPGLSPSDRALVWGVLDGVPLYLSWWDASASVRANMSELFGRSGARLLTEGQLVLESEGDSGDLGRRVLHAIATGRTKHNEIADAVGADPARTLDRLVELRLVERFSPIIDDPRRTRRRVYRIADNFLAFWLGTVDRLRSEIEFGIGDGAVTAMVDALDDAMGRPWEVAVRDHLRRLSETGVFGPDVVGVGPVWRDGVAELDAVVVAGRARRPVAIAEVKWSKAVDGERLAADLSRRAHLLGIDPSTVRLVIAARERVERAPNDVLVVTSADVFGG